VFVFPARGTGLRAQMFKAAFKPHFSALAHAASTLGGAARYSNEWLAWLDFQKRVFRRRRDRLH
jgi:hypothetical protein